MASEASVSILGVVNRGDVHFARDAKDQSDVTLGVRVAEQADEIGCLLHQVRPGARVRLIIELPERE